MEVPRHWRLREQRYQLKGEICPHCDAKIIPPRPVCPHCGHGLVQRQGALQIVVPVIQPVVIEW